MIKDGIKSILINKSNIIYIFIFIVIAILINIAININNIIDQYYDNEFNKLIDSKVSLGVDSLSEDYRTIGLTLASTLDDDTIEKIKEINHVEEIKKMQMKDEKVLSANLIVVDDWKNCNYVQKELKKIGLDSYTINDNSLMDSYSTINKYSNIIVYFSIIASFVVLIICCNNILKNEETNNKILNILGYTKKDIKKIAFFQLMTIMIIGFIFGALMATVTLFIYTNNLLKIDNNYNIIATILINIGIILLSIMISLKNVKCKI